MQRRILVTDGSYKHALGIVRDLARRGHHVVACSEHHLAPARFSRYTAAFRVVPPATTSGFAESLIALIESERIDLLIPVGYYTCREVSHQRERIGAVCALFAPPPRQLARAADKWEMHCLAERLAVPTPATHLVSDFDALDAWLRTHPGPWVVKSRYEGADKRVRYFDSGAQLEFLRDPAAARSETNSELIVQQQVRGDGYGYFALYRDGKFCAQFMHHRIREYPVSGGPSCCAESVIDETLAQLGRRVLDTLEWNGVAMVEFKRDERDGRYHLLEVNPKFWGSHDLALHCGVSFPALLAAGVSGTTATAAPRYSAGVRFHWPWSGDWKSALCRPRWFADVISDTVDPRVGSNIWWSDPLPNLIELASGLNPGRLKGRQRRT